MEQKRFDGRVVVVTGGTGGLGAAVVARVVAEGGRVLVPVFREAELEGFAHRDHAAVRTVLDVDLTEVGAVEGVYAAAAELGELWASVHVAGGFAMGGIGDGDGREFAKMMAMNGATAYLCCREAVRRMRGRPSEDGEKGGRIVNVSARPGEVPTAGKGMVAYAASKAAVSAMTRALAAELADDQIWVNAVAPSTIDTPANREAMPDADHDAWPTPEEIAATVCFLASPENRVTTGGVVPVYGRV